MKIISHRGYWKGAVEKNTNIAFERSFSLNYGTETDFRDYMEEIVISHDIANNTCVTANEFFKIFVRYNPSLTLALNIKADGLQKHMLALLKRYKIEQYFVFDMSIPDTIGYIENGIKFYSRQSEYELEPVFYDKCNGVWLDSFTDIWYDVDLIKKHIRNGKQVAIVSADLHKRDPYKLWCYLKQNNLHVNESLILCTDTPENATAFFKI